MADAQIQDVLATMMSFSDHNSIRSSLAISRYSVQNDEIGDFEEESNENESRT